MNSHKTAREHFALPPLEKVPVKNVVIHLPEWSGVMTGIFVGILIGLLLALVPQMFNRVQASFTEIQGVDLVKVSDVTRLNEPTLVGLIATDNTVAIKTDTEMSVYIGRVRTVSVDKVDGVNKYHIVDKVLTFGLVKDPEEINQGYYDIPLEDFDHIRGGMQQASMEVTR